MIQREGEDRELTEPFDLATLRARIAAVAGMAGAAPREGRGIVVAAGGARIFTNAYVLIAVLRRTLGCRLPIELWHFGPSEMSPAMAATLDGLDVRLVDAEAAITRRGAAIHDGWQLKPFAMLWSRFAEVLLLDADQVPVVDPTVAFDWPEYRATGAVFWPDIIDLRADNPAWGLLGLTGAETVSFESGQVLVDVRRHGHALAATLALNERAALFYRHLYGDKDTFLMGWRLAGAPCAVVPHRPLIDERALFQRDFAGAPIFQHRTQSKWVYSGEQRVVSGFVHTDACLTALAELRTKWNGRVFTPPARGTAARAAERALCDAGRISLDLHDEGVIPVVLRPHHEIGEGRAYDRQNWYVAGTGDDLVLAFHDGERVSYRFERAAPGSWVGQRLRWPVIDAVLRADPRATDSGDGPGLLDALLRAAGFWDDDGRGDTALQPTLALVARVEAGVVPRLRALARTHPAQADRLRAIADTLETAETHHPSLRVGDAIGTGYRRADGTDA